MTPRKRVFVTRAIAEPALERLRDSAAVDVWEGELPPPHRELIRRLKNADGVLSMLTDRFDAATIGRLPRLRVISNMAVGVDNIDLAAATARAIPVGHTPGVLTETTADLAFALLMAAARRISEADAWVRAGRWRTWGPAVMLGRDVYRATLGIIGWGATGRAMARRACGFDMRLLYVSRESHTGQRTKVAPGVYAHAVSLRRLLEESDFVSLHVPLTPHTSRMLGAREFAMMKPEAIVINTARGGVIDQKAMAAALRSGRLGGAGLDVTDPEPISTRDPILRMRNVVLAPHIGSASHATRLKMAEMAVDNILDAFAGRHPRFCANPQEAL